MPIHLESETWETNDLIHPANSQGEGGKVSARNTWIKVGAIAATSAVLGGLAAAWFYRKTLARLQDAQHELSHSEFSTIRDDSPEDF
jgi:hypothetical protein